MSIFMRIRRFVDWDLSKNGWGRVGAYSTVIGVLPFVPMMLMASADIPFPKALYIAPVVLALAWFLFVGWRSWRLSKAIFAKSDRRYDQHTKFELPLEYRDTESVMKARQRIRRN